MSVSSQSLILWAFLPLVAGIVFQLLTSKILSSTAKGIFAFLFSLPSLAAVVLAFLQVRAQGPIDWVASSWDGPLTLVFHVDNLSLMFAAMGTVLGSAVLLYSIGYMAHDKGATRFYVFMLIFIFGMVGLVYSANLFPLYLCWEMMGLCSFNLVGFWYEKPQSVAGARKVLLMTHLAGYGLLAAILLIYSRTGSTLWTNPGVAHAFTAGVYTLMLVALLAKSVQFPLHTWIPEAMNAPTPVSALLHAACYVKAGVYLAARMHSFGPWPTSWCMVMMWLGTVTMVVGVVYAMIQHDLKRMLAFHTVSQIGYIITGIGLGTPLGIVAGLLHCLNHSLFKGGLFLAAGSVQHATDTRDMNELGGLARRMPHTTITWLISVGSMMGVPFMSGFASKWLLYTAALQAGQVVPALLAWVVSIGTVFSCVKATSAVFLGPASAKSEKAHEAPATMVWSLRFFAFGSLVMGLAPQLAVNYVLNPILPLFGMSTVQVSWFGLTPAAGSWWTSTGLLLAVASAVAGLILYVMAGMSRARVAAAAAGGMTLEVGGGVAAFTGGEPMVGNGHMPASDFSAILKKAWAPVYRVTDVDKVYLSVWSVLEGISALVGKVTSAIERYAAVYAVVAFVALAAGLAAVVPGAAAVANEAAATSIPLLLTAACGLALVALLVAIAAQKAFHKLLPLTVLSGAFAVAATLVKVPVERTGLLELSSVLALALIWRVASKRAAGIYLSVVLLSAVGICGGELALAQSQSGWAVALLLAGFVLKLAIAPALLWLPAVAEEVPALVMGLVIAVVDMAAFGEFYLAAGERPAMLQPAGLWIGLALASSFLGALLMLTQRNMKRLLAFSTIEDMGFLLLGVLTANQIGLQGALLGAAAHAIAKTLLFVSVSAPEADGNLREEVRGLASRYPVSAAGFMAGMLAMLGVPPMVGFAGRWRLYLSAANTDHCLLAGFIFSSMLALVAYVLCLTRYWWGPTETEPAVANAAHESWAVRLVVVVLIAALILGGVFPNALLALAGGL